MTEESKEETKQPKLVFNVMKHSTGFYDVIHIITQNFVSQGALASFEINKFLDDMCDKEGIDKKDVVVRVFSVNDIEDKERL